MNMDNRSVTEISNPPLKNQLESINKEALTIVNTSKEIDIQFSVLQSSMPVTRPVSSARMEMQNRIDDFKKGHEERMAILKDLNTNADLIPNYEGAERVKQIMVAESEDLKSLLDAPFEIVINNWRKDMERIEQNFFSPTQLATKVAKRAANDVKQWSTAQIQKLFPGKDQNNLSEMNQENSLINEIETTKISF